MGFCLSFGCVNRWTWEEDSRELPSTFLKRKRDKSEVRVQIFAWTHGKWEVLGCSICLRKSRKRWGGAWWLYVQVLVFGFVHKLENLALHVLNFNWLHVGGISTIVSHASCIVKTPTTIYIYIYMYVCIS